MRPPTRALAPCTRIVVHASGSDQDGLVLLPDLDALLAAKAQALLTLDGVSALPAAGRVR